MAIPFIQENVKPSVNELRLDLAHFFPELTHFYGYAAGPDHNTKRCLDAMVYDSSNKYVGQQGRKNLPYSQRIALGDRILSFLKKNADHYGLNGVIWNRKVYGFPHTGGTNNYKGPYGVARTYTQSAHDDHLHIDQDGSSFKPLRPTTPLPVYYVDPDEVTTSLIGNPPAGKQAVNLPPRTAITNAVQVDGDWVVTSDGYRYHKDYLTTVKPADVQPPVVVPPVVVPPKPVLPTYTVKAGDTLAGIAGRIDTTWQDVAELNPGINPHSIDVGQVITVPKAVPPVVKPPVVTKPDTKPEPEPPVDLPTYWVDPAKVSTYLWGVRHSDGEPIHKRAPRFGITTAKEIVTVDGRQWVLTDAGYRYALDYLTTKKPTSPPKPGKVTLQLKAWNGSPAGRTLIQGVKWDEANDCYFIHQADTVAGQKEQTIVVRRHDADGTYRGYLTLPGAGHGSSIGLENVSTGVVRLWVGHATKGAGYVTYRIGNPDTPWRSVPLPNGDFTVDQDTDTICIRSGTLYRGYRLSSAADGKAVKLWECRIPNWMNRFQGHHLAGGRLYIHRDVATKGSSELRSYTYQGAKLGAWNTNPWGDEAEGCMTKAGWVWSVSRVGGDTPNRTVVCTPIEQV